MSNSIHTALGTIGIAIFSCDVVLLKYTVVLGHFIQRSGMYFNVFDQYN